MRNIETVCAIQLMLFLFVNNYRDRHKHHLALPPRRVSFFLCVRILTALGVVHPVGTVHLLPTTIIHSLLLLGQLADALPDSHALWNRTDGILALLCVDAEQSPDPLADAASTSGLYLARPSVLHVGLHLGTIR